MADFSKLPQTLRSSGRWIRWDLRTVEGRDAKVPVSHVTGEPINHLDPKNWISFEQAIQPSPRSTGPGLVIGLPLVGIDIDGCYDPETGEWEPWAWAFIEQHKTYWEFSPSRTGVHGWLHGDAGDLKEEKRDGIEIYSCNHYLTVSGEHVPGTPDDAHEASKEEIEDVGRLIREGKIRPQPEPISDPTKYELLQKGKIVEAGYDDASKAVATFVLCLVDRLGPKTVDIDKAFRESKLYGKVSNGEKTTDWAKKWNRLWKKEIARAIAWRKDNPLRRAKQKGEQWTKRELITKNGGRVRVKETRFYWKPYLPAGKLIHGGGKSSEGKSPVTIDLAARITKGAPWPDDTPNLLGPRRVLLLNIEDDLETTILPRFLEAGGNRDLLEYVKGTRLSNDSTALDRGTALDQDMDLLQKLAREFKDLGAIIIDPITNYLGKLKMNAEEEVRSVLTPLANLAEELDIVVITIGHFNRREKGTDPLFRMMGAAAFSGVARAVYAFGPDPEDRENKYAHVMTTVRGAAGEGESLRYCTVLVEDAEFDGVKTSVIRVEWRGKSSATSEDAVDPNSRKDASAETEAAKVLAEFLKAGRKPASECQQFLKNGGFDLGKLNEGRIRKKAGARTSQKDKQWWWELKASMFDSEM